MNKTSNCFLEEICKVFIVCLIVFMPLFAQAQSSVTFAKEEAQLLNQLNEKDRALAEFSANFSLLPLVQLFTSNPLDVASQLLIQEGVQYIYGVDEYSAFENTLVRINSAHCKSQSNLITYYFVSNKISRENDDFFKELRKKYEMCGKR